jgi:hypothetical protein
LQDVLIIGGGIVGVGVIAAIIIGRRRR